MYTSKPRDAAILPMRSLEQKLHVLLSRLPKARKLGESKWIANCPGHDDKSPSMGIKLVDDRILIHCFSGCSVEEILSPLSLTVADLFPDRQRLDGNKPKVEKFNRYELFPVLVHHARILYLSFQKFLNGEEMTVSDLKSIEQAMKAIENLEAEVSR